MSVTIVTSTAAGPLDAQDLVFEATGVQANREYFSQLPFEHIDTLTGSLVLTYTDLVLPGNAGLDLRFTRTYNSKTGTWAFGISDFVMRVIDNGWTQQPRDQGGRALAELVGSDGAHHGLIYMTPPADQTEFDRFRWLQTDQFWTFDRQTQVLLLPDGRVGRYDAQHRLQSIQDPFGNSIMLAWSNNQVVVAQDLGGGETRTVVVTLYRPEGTYVTLDNEYTPASIRFSGSSAGGSTWTYSYVASSFLLHEVQPPVGPSWLYDYGGTSSEGDSIDLIVTTPQGGIIEYDARQLFIPTTLFTGQPGTKDHTKVITHRRTSGRSLEAGTWTYRYGEGGYVSTHTETLAPDGTRTMEDYSLPPIPPSSALPQEFIGRQWGLRQRLITDGEGHALQKETRSYQYVPLANLLYAAVPAVPELLQRTIQRPGDGSGTSLTTTFTYDTANFGDYHHPKLIEEQGDLSRTTRRIFAYVAPFVVGLVASESVTVGPETFERSSTFDPATGFRTSQTEYGLTRSFTSERGNVRTVTNGNGHTTTYSYRWGMVSRVDTPAYTVGRVINQEGTVAAETRAGRTTTFQYDSLFRLTQTQPPYATLTATSYGPGGNTITVTRAGSSTLTTLDGFGRTIGTVNRVGEQTNASYDALGRMIYQGYPYVSANIGTTIEYDGLGRVARRINPDGSASHSFYDDGARRVTVVDENGHPTVQTYAAFGDPGDLRLVSLDDAAGNTWRYTYNAIGQLTSVGGPPGPNGEPIERTWQYGVNGVPPALLGRESHPESGTVAYVEYDAAGNLLQKRDANGTLFIYNYDGNERLSQLVVDGQVTQFTYEPGSDNRQTAVRGAVATRFSYDAAGHLAGRVDAIGNQSWTRLFEYSGTDDLTRLTYASGRRVRYVYDTEHRVTRVYDEATQANYAAGFSYHPSGAVASFTSGNGLSNVFQYDPARYWPRSVQVGSLLQLTYSQYDAAGNLLRLGDGRASRTQSFQYDQLDRLVTADGPAWYGTTSYAYDGHGNRTNAGGTAYTYHGGTLRLASQQLLGQSPEAFTYDGNGNLLTDGTRTYSYTPANLVATETGPAAAATYVYDADDWRVAKSLHGSGSYYLRGNDGELLTEWIVPATGSAKARDYIYAAGRLLAVASAPATLIDPPAATGQITPNGPGLTVTLAAGENALVAFLGAAGRRVDARLTNGTFAGTCFAFTLSILKPDGTTLSSASSCFDGANGFLDAATMPVSGMYLLKLAPARANAGTATLFVHIFDDVTGSITPNGAGIGVMLGPPGQNALLTFAGTAGQRASVRLTNGTFPGTCFTFTLSILRPDGTKLSSADSCYDGANGFLDAVTMPVSGIYTAKLDPIGVNAGSATLLVYTFDDVTGLITGGELQVSAPADHDQFLAWVAGKPFGQQTLLDLEPTLNAAGWLLTPPNAAGERTKVHLPNGPWIRVGFGEGQWVWIPQGDSGVSVSLPTPGQSAALTFTGIAGRRVSARLTNGTFAGTCFAFTLSILKPDGTKLSSADSCYDGVNGFLDAATMPVSGVYTLKLDPVKSNTGSATLFVYTFDDVAGPITVGIPAAAGTQADHNRLLSWVAGKPFGQQTLLNLEPTLTAAGWLLTPPNTMGDRTKVRPPNGPWIRVGFGEGRWVWIPQGESGIEVSLPTPGQNALLTFPGSAGQQVTASFDGQTFQSCAYLSVLKPDGSTLISRLGCGAALALPPQTLPGTGIYTVKLDPAGGGAGSATVSITSP
ncbi:MAG: DUF6531 domain-containing protein [Acidobacteriota bacterium]